jgi:hypothetical protein
MFYGNRLVVNSFKDLPESALNQFQRHRDLAVSGKGPVDQVQRPSWGRRTTPHLSSRKNLGKPDCLGVTAGVGPHIF